MCLACTAYLPAYIKAYIQCTHNVAHRTPIISLRPTPNPMPRTTSYHHVSISSTQWLLPVLPVQCTLFSVHCTEYTAQWTVYSVQVLTGWRYSRDVTRRLRNIAISHSLSASYIAISRSFATFIALFLASSHCTSRVNIYVDDIIPAIILIYILRNNGIR